MNLRLLLALLGALAACGCASRPGVPDRPNIVLVLVDDLGWRDLAATGSDFYRTPHVDRVAREGMTFTSAYAASCVCSPTRAALLTGLAPARLNITDWIPGARFPRARLRVPDIHKQLPDSTTTLAEVLRDAGYRTLHVGKWHLGADTSSPLEHGFDVNIGGHAAGHPASYFHPYGRPGDFYTVRNLPPGGEEGEYLTDRLTDEAIRLIHENRDRPFFLHLSHYAVHTPLQARAEVIERYRGARRPGLTHTNATYAAMVESVDDGVGRLMDTLRALDLDRRTLVIITSDNGGEKSATSNSPLRDAKGTLYEGGTRVPLIVRWPGVVPGASTCDTPVITMDLFPTLTDAAALAGVGAGAADGLSLLPLLTDPGAGLGRDALHWHYPHYHTAARPPCSSVRAGDLKLIEFHEDARVELYDLRADPGETTDLAGARPDDAARLRARLHAWLTEVGARMPELNPDHEPAGARAPAAPGEFAGVCACALAER